jgi:hypothetical protein
VLDMESDASFEFLTNIPNILKRWWRQCQDITSGSQPMSPQRLAELHRTMLWYFKTIVDPSNYSTTLEQAARLFDELHGHIESNTDPEPETLAAIWRACVYRVRATASSVLLNKRGTARHCTGPRADRRYNRSVPWREIPLRRPTTRGGKVCLSRSMLLTRHHERRSYGVCDAGVCSLLI